MLANMPGHDKPFLGVHGLEGAGAGAGAGAGTEPEMGAEPEAGAGEGVGVGVAASATGLTLEAAALPEHVPKAELQDAPQWSVVLPHHPYWLQQFPKVDPEQVKPVVPPHEPSVETLPEALEADGAGAAVVDAGLVVETAPLEPQLPKPVWQPVPQ
jgi:hypothetical protein